MEVSVRQTHAIKLPMKAASILSVCIRQKSRKEEKRRIVIGTYELATEEKSLDDKNERCGGICVVDLPILSPILRHNRLPSGVFRLVKPPLDSSAAVATLTDGRLALLTEDHFDSIGDDLRPFVPSYSSILSSGMLLDCAINSDGRLVCSDNFGNLFLLRFALDGFHSVDCQWRAHSSQFGGVTDTCEVWSCCWVDGGKCCASGGEDALLKIWDIRCPTKGTLSAQLTNRSHSAGVVFLASSDSVKKNLDEPSDDCLRTSANLLLSGSYDDHLRAFDLRHFSRPLNEIKLNGGVWSVERLSDDLLLVACMYGGWSVVRGLPSPFELIYSHSVFGPNLLYAATSVAPSVAVGAIGGARYTVASCTFNDAMMRLEEIYIC